jgi:hypothetical protein
VGDGPEGQQPARIHSLFLSDRDNQYLRLCKSASIMDLTSHNDRFDGRRPTEALAGG